MEILLFYEMRKKQGTKKESKKRVVYVRGGSHARAEVQEHP
jgi:hypothetical protein